MDFRTALADALGSLRVKKTTEFSRGMVLSNLMLILNMIKFGA